MEGGPGTTSILVLLCSVALCQTHEMEEYVVDIVSTCYPVPPQGARPNKCKFSCCETQLGEADVLNALN